VVKETKEEDKPPEKPEEKFQSPLGEVVKETFCCIKQINGGYIALVSIPSRGSGKGDTTTDFLTAILLIGVFQSPLGEVVKETR
jgi:hypothetical protein